MRGRATTAAILLLAAGQVAQAQAATRCRAQSAREIVASSAAASPSDLAAQAQSLYAIGYRNLELAKGVDNAPPGAAGIAKTAKLDLVGVRETLNLKTWDAVVAKAKALGVDYIAADAPGAPGVGSLEDTLQTAANLTVMGEAARAEKMTLIVRLGRAEMTSVYPFDPRSEGKPVPTRAADILMAMTDEDDVQFDFESGGAIQALGAGAAQGVPDFLAAHRGRLAMLHIRDMTAAGAPANVGQGSIDWAGVFAAAGGSVRYYLTDEAPGTPVGLARARSDFDYLRCAS